MRLPTGTQFRELVSGQQRGLIATGLRGLLWLAEGPYALAVTLRNRGYDRRPGLIHRVDVPVVSVGNLTLGGTGKSPLVQYLARHFRNNGVRVSVVSRGYGSEEGSSVNDEALQLERHLPDVPHVENPDRVAAAKLALEELATQLILLDDGFQHRRLHRDLDIVLLDATEPWGHDHVFPRGTLREPVAGLRRADVVALSRADLLSLQQREQLRQQVAKLAPRALWCELEHQPRKLVNQSCDQQPVETFQGQAVSAFCGIGNPTAFRHTLQQTLSYQLRQFREFADHHRYTREDVHWLRQWAEKTGDPVLCTEKDLVKLQTDSLGTIPLWAVAIETKVTSGQDELADLLKPLEARALAVDLLSSPDNFAM